MRKAGVLSSLGWREEEMRKGGGKSVGKKEERKEKLGVGKQAPRGSANLILNVCVECDESRPRFHHFSM